MKAATRAFQRVPTGGAETERGEPIVEFGSVRLVLPHGSQHFRHLVNCSRCGQESVGEVVLSGSSLRPPAPIFCDSCTFASVEVPAQRRPSPEVPAPPPPSPEAWQAAVVEDEPEPEQEASQVVAPVASEERRTISRALEQQTRAVEAAAVDQLRGQEELGTQLLGDFSRQLEQHREVLTSAVTDRLDQRYQQLVAKLEADLEARLEQHREALAGAVVDGLEQRYQQLVTQLGAALGQRLEQHRQVVQAGLGHQQGQSHDQLVSTVINTLEQHRQAVEATVFDRLEQSRQTLKRALSDRPDQDPRPFFADLEAAITRQLSAHSEELLEVYRREREGLRSELLSGVAELEVAVRSANKDMAEGLERVADRAGSAGTLSLALLQAAGERLLGSMASLAAQVSDVRVALAATQRDVAALRDDLVELRSGALRPAHISTEPTAPRALPERGAVEATTTARQVPAKKAAPGKRPGPSPSAGLPRSQR